MEAQNWFYVKDGRISQPVDVQELERLYRIKYFSGDDLVCKLGDVNWNRYRDVFLASDAPPIPMSCLNQTYAIIISLSPVFAMCIVSLLLSILQGFQVNLYVLSVHITIIVWFVITIWLVILDEKRLKNAIHNYPKTDEIKFFMPYLYLVMRNLILRRIYMRTEWVSIILLVINIFSFIYVFRN